MGSYKIILQPHQYDFYDDIKNKGIKERALVAGIGGGKTFIGAFTAAILSDIYPCPGLVCANSYAQLKDSTIEEAKEAWDLMGVNYNIQLGGDNKYLFLDGRRHFLRSLDFDKPRLIDKNLKGMKIGWAWIDEASFTSFLNYKKVLGRLRHPDGPRVIFCTMTGNGRNWIYDHFIQDLFKDPKLAASRKIVTGITSDDNPHLPADYLELIKSSYSGKFALQEIGGQLVSMEGAVFNIPDSQFIDYGYDPGGFFEIAVDFGRRRPAVIFLQECENEIDVIFDSILPERPDGILIQDLCDLIKLRGYGDPLTIYCDPAGDSGNTHTYDTDISIMRDFFPDSIIRYTRQPALTRLETGTAILDNRLKREKLFIARHLEKLKDMEYTSVIRAFNEIAYPAEKEGKPISNKYEKEGRNEHPIDAVRYWVINKYPINRGRVGAMQ